MSALFAMVLLFSGLTLYLGLIKLFAKSVRPAGPLQGFVVGSYEDLADTIDQYCRCEECTMCGSICGGKRG
jgi:hypothetical protein